MIDWFSLLETGSHCAAQAGLELTFVAQAGLELAPILLPLPPECWDYRHEPPRPAMSFKFSRDNIYILRARTRVWLPIQLHHSWQDSPSMMLFQQKGSLNSWCEAFTSRTATTRVTLSQGIQAVYFVQQWHKDLKQLWTSQRHIDSELKNKISDLKQAVVKLKSQIVNL